MLCSAIVLEKLLAERYQLRYFCEVQFILTVNDLRERVTTLITITLETTQYAYLAKGKARTFCLTKSPED